MYREFFICIGLYRQLKGKNKYVRHFLQNALNYTPLAKKLQSFAS